MLFPIRVESAIVLVADGRPFHRCNERQTGEGKKTEDKGKSEGHKSRFPHAE